MNSQSQSTLVSLAMLKVHINHNRDYLEYFKPFVRFILHKYKPDQITDQLVSDYVETEFGLIVPPRSIQIILKRISKQKDIHKKDGIYIINKEIQEPGLERRKAEAERHINSVIGELISFWEDESTERISHTEAIEAIIDFLSEFSVPYLKVYLRGNALPVIADLNQKYKVIISKFLVSIHNKSPERFESFMVLMQGHMLANGILCPDLANAPKSYKHTTFFLDTPVLLELFGYEGEIKKKTSSALIESLQKLHGKLAIFIHTLDETKGVIRWASENLDSKSGCRTIITEILKRGDSKSDLILFLGRIRDELKKLNIEVFSTPAYSMEYQIDEKSFEEYLDNEIHYSRPQARRNDINSVRSIYELRKDARPSNIENSKAVLITNNAAFSKAAYEFGKEHPEVQGVSSVITDFSLANMAWLKNPLEAQSIPKNELLAYSYAALCPSEDLLNKFLDEIERLKKAGKLTERDHQFLRSSYYINDELMTLTLGEEEALTAETVLEINKRITTEIKKEETQKLVEEQDKHRETQLSLNSANSVLENIMEATYRSCKMKSNALTIIMNSLYSLMCLSSIIGSFFVFSETGKLKWIVSISLLIYTILSNISLYFGTSFKQINQRISTRILTYCLIQEEKKKGFKFDRKFYDLDDEHE